MSKSLLFGGGTSPLRVCKAWVAGRAINSEPLNPGLQDLGFRVDVAPYCYLWLVGNGGMGYNYNYFFYHSSIPYFPKVGNKVPARLCKPFMGLHGSKPLNPVEMYS